jgi:hypothetical protein
MSRRGDTSAMTLEALREEAHIILREQRDLLPMMFTRDDAVYRDADRWLLHGGFDNTPWEAAWHATLNGFRNYNIGDPFILVNQRDDMYVPFRLLGADEHGNLRAWITGDEFEACVLLPETLVTDGHGQFTSQFGVFDYNGFIHSPQGETIIDLLDVSVPRLVRPWLSTAALSHPMAHQTIAELGTQVRRLRNDRNAWQDKANKYEPKAKAHRAAHDSVILALQSEMDLKVTMAREYDDLRVEYKETAAKLVNINTRIYFGLFNLIVPQASHLQSG